MKQGGKYKNIMDCRLPGSQRTRILPILAGLDSLVIPVDLGVVHELVLGLHQGLEVEKSRSTRGGGGAL